MWQWLKYADQFQTTIDQYYVKYSDILFLNEAYLTRFSLNLKKLFYRYEKEFVNIVFTRDINHLLYPPKFCYAALICSKTYQVSHQLKFD